MSNNLVLAGQLGPFSVEFARPLTSPGQLLSRCFGFLPQSKDMQFRFISNSNLSMHGRPSLCVNHVIDWQPVQDPPRLSLSIN